MELGQTIVVSMVTFLIVVATVAVASKYAIKYKKHLHNH